jgi:hypothetical protein
LISVGLPDRGFSRDLQARNCEKRPELQGSNERTDAGRAM